MPYLLGTYVHNPAISSSSANVTENSNTQFVILGTYGTKDEAKAAVEGLANPIMQGQYKSVTLYELNEENNKLYTFKKGDVKAAYARMQEQLLQQQRQRIEEQSKYD